MKFTDLNLSTDLLNSVKECGFEELTPIQEHAFAPVVEGQDFAGCAQTGTGKTAAYLLPLIERWCRSTETTEPDEHSKKRQIKDFQTSQMTLILVPTRELADQVLTNIHQLTKYVDIEAVAVYGGMDYQPQKDKIKKGVQFLIATPGRLIDLYKDHVIDLQQVNAVVFDEADRMFDFGFKDDMRYLLQRIPKSRQFLIFTATLNFEVMSVAYQFGAEPVEVNLGRDEPKAENVTDTIFHVGEDEKPQHLLSLLKKHQPEQVIVFSNYKKQVERLSYFLNQNNIPAEGISSLLSQSQRNRIMDRFKKGEVKILVATDVAARGLDIKGVDIVINYELPDFAENYIHRIGRTGRAGRKGEAFALVCDTDVEALSRIQEYLGHKVEMAWIESTDLVEDFEKFPKYVPSEKLEKLNHKRRNHTGSKKSSGPYKSTGSSSGPSRSKTNSSSSSKKHSATKHRDKTHSKPYVKAKAKDSPTSTTQPKKKSTVKKTKPSSSAKTRSGGRVQGRVVRTNAKKATVGSKLTGMIKKLFS